MSGYGARTNLTCWVATLVFIVSTVVGLAQTPQARSAATYVARGNDWYKKGELDRAMADSNIALTFEARCAQAYLLRGLVKHDRGNLEGALADFDRAIEVEPRFAEAYYNRGRVHRARGNWNAAVADISKAIEDQTPSCSRLQQPRRGVPLDGKTRGCSSRL